VKHKRQKLRRSRKTGYHWTGANFLESGSAVFLAAAFAASAAGQDIQKVAKAQQDKNGSDAGPENALWKEANPNTPDHGEVETFWNSFSVSLQRVQNGEWSRQVEGKGFSDFDGIAGVNTRLTGGKNSRTALVRGRGVGDYAKRKCANHGDRYRWEEFRERCDQESFVVLSDGARRRRYKDPRRAVNSCRCLTAASSQKSYTRGCQAKNTSP
jgi:hypothetical protein